MRRVVSVFLPLWPIDRLRRRGAVPPGRPFATVRRDGPRRVLAAVGADAAALGLRAGMALAHARAAVPGLLTAEADPDADEAGLLRLALWCRRYAPLTAPDPPDGLWLDVTGCAHLQGGEESLLLDLARRLGGAGLAVRAAAAATPGAAHALARYGQGATTVAADAQALLGLPVAALRLPPGTEAALRRLGLERVGQLLDLPRAPLARRFGPVVRRRLDQALGAAFESIRPVLPAAEPRARLAFAEPVAAAEALRTAVGRLSGELCRRLRDAALGARRLDLLFERADGCHQAVRIGTARPTRDAAHLARLLGERLDGVDPGLGVDAVTLAAPLTEPLGAEQLGTPLAGRPAADLAALVDRLANRFGAERLYRVAAIESDLPERSTGRVAPLAPPTGRSWPDALPRPGRLLHPPEPVETLALLPDHPPRLFTWRRVRHPVRRADGPERVFGEWWRADGERTAVRDYFQVEDDAGRRFWLFRAGDEAGPAGGPWFLHGLFG